MLNVNARGAQARKHNVMRAAAAGCIGCQAETHVLILGSPAAAAVIGRHWEVKAGSVHREKERETVPPRSVYPMKYRGRVKINV